MQSQNPHNLTEAQQEKLKRQIGIMQSYSHGKLIEESFMNFGPSGWVESIEPIWDWESFNYRVAINQIKISQTEFIDCQYDEDFVSHETASGLRIKRKTLKKYDNQIKSSSVNTEPSERLSIKLKQIDDEYLTKPKLTIWQSIKLILFIK